MSESKKHHYVPRSLLRGFLIPGTEQVYVFDKKETRVYKAGIANVAAENRYNTLVVQVCARFGTPSSRTGESGHGFVLAIRADQ